MRRFLVKINNEWRMWTLVRDYRTNFVDYVFVDLNKDVIFPETYSTVAEALDGLDNFEWHPIEK